MYCILALFIEGNLQRFAVGGSGILESGPEGIRIMKKVLLAPVVLLAAG